MATQGLTLDTGAFIAAENGDRMVWRLLKTARDRGARLTVPAPVVAQVWRDPPHPQIARLVKACEVTSLGEASAKAVGRLLGKAIAHDVVDGAVVASAVDRGNAILTSDPTDVRRLLKAAGSDLPIVAV